MSTPTDHTRLEHSLAHGHDRPASIEHAEHPPDRKPQRTRVTRVSHDAVHAVRHQRLGGADAEFKGKVRAEGVEAVGAEEGT